MSTVDYYNHSFVSNSDLSSVKKLGQTSVAFDYEAAQRRGSMLDAIITQPSELSKYNPTNEEMKQLKFLKKSFMENHLCKQVYENSFKQYEMYAEDVPFEYNGISFTLDCRCLWDFYMNPVKHGMDMKRTAAKTKEQFLSDAYMFEYTRSRAFYMHINHHLTGKKKPDGLIGVSETGEIFYIPISWGDEFHRLGMEQVNELAHKFWVLYGKSKKPMHYKAV